MLAIAPLCNQIHYFFMGRHRLTFPYLFPIRYERSLISSGLKCLIMRRKTVGIKSAPDMAHQVVTNWPDGCDDPIYVSAVRWWRKYVQVLFCHAKDSSIRSWT